MKITEHYVSRSALDIMSLMATLANVNGHRSTAEGWVIHMEHTMNGLAPARLASMFSPDRVN